MDTICNNCLLNAGCAFNKMTDGIAKCRDYININLSRREAKAAVDRVMNNPIALTMNDIEMEV